MVDCGTEGTVSVSTVMLRKGGWVAERVDSDDSDGFDVTRVGLWADAERCSCILPFWVDFGPLSLPLPVCLPWSLVFFVLRSSVTFDELTSLRSSSEGFCEDVEEEMKLG
jgi:hypothetical protein